MLLARHLRWSTSLCLWFWTGEWVCGIWCIFYRARSGLVHRCSFRRVSAWSYPHQICHCHTYSSISLCPNRSLARLKFFAPCKVIAGGPLGKIFCGCIRFIFWLPLMFSLQFWYRHEKYPLLDFFTLVYLVSYRFIGLQADRCFVHNSSCESKRFVFVAQK